MKNSLIFTCHLAIEKWQPLIVMTDGGHFAHGIIPFCMSVRLAKNIKVNGAVIENNYYVVFLKVLYTVLCYTSVPTEVSFMFSLELCDLNCSC